MEDEKPTVIFVPADSEENTTGYPYDLYIPAGVNVNTPVHLYVPGSNGSGKADSNDTRALKKYLNEVGSNSVVIMPRWDGVSGKYNDRYAKEILTISDAVIKKYGVNANNVSIAGFSNGGAKAPCAALLSLGEEYKTKINQAVVLDGGFGLNEDEMKRLIENDVIIYSFPGGNGYSYATKYAELGGTAIRIKSKNSGHTEINARAYENGLVDFLAANKDLGNVESRYEISMYNVETKKWEVLPYDELKKIVDAQNGNAEQVEGSIIGTNEISIDTVKSDDDVLQGYIDKIHRNMESTRSMPFTPEQYVSTTATPNNNSKVVAQFFQATEKLLHNLASDTNYVLTVGSKLQEMDEKLKERAEGLAEPPALPGGDPGETATKKHTFGELALNVGGYGASGAIIGTAINPGLGTIIGFGIGAVVGVAATYWQEIVGFFKGLGTKKDSEPAAQTTPTTSPEPTIEPTPTPDILGTE